ncbi:murein biosynthesis integral membrane protein MurJ [Cloacibacillus porcorum]
MIGIVIILTGIAKIFGAMRDIFLSYYYGSGSISDAYIIATTIPVVIFSFIYEGIAASFIPVCTRLKTQTEENSLINNLISHLFIFSLIIIIIIQVCSDEIIGIFAPGFSASTLTIASYMLRLSIVGSIFSCYVYVFAYYLNYCNSFILPTIRSIPMNLTIICSIVVSAKTQSILPLAIGIPISMFTELFCLGLYSRKFGYRFFFVIDTKSQDIRKIAKWSLPIILASSVAEINSIIDRQFASYIIEGGISIVTYSSRTLDMARTAFIMPIATIIFPVIAKAAYNNVQEEIDSVFIKSLSLVIIIAMPVTALLIIYASDIINILFGRGAFSNQSAELSSICLKFYAISLVGHAIVAIGTKTFHAMTDMKTILYISLFALVVNIIGNFVLSKYLLLGGLALSASISISTMAITQYYILWKKIKFKNSEIFFILIKSSIAALIMSMFVSIVNRNISIFNYPENLIGCIMQVFLISTLGLIIYIVILQKMNIKIKKLIFKRV